MFKTKSATSKRKILKNEDNKKSLVCKFTKYNNNITRIKYQ